jgi:hypothetical protein
MDCALCKKSDSTFDSQSIPTHCTTSEITGNNPSTSYAASGAIGTDSALAAAPQSTPICTTGAGSVTSNI